MKKKTFWVVFKCPETLQTAHIFLHFLAGLLSPSANVTTGDREDSSTTHQNNYGIHKIK